MQIFRSFQIGLLFLFFAASQSVYAQEACDAEAYDTQTGLSISWDGVVDAASNKSIVFFGERHGIAAHAMLAGCLLKVWNKPRPEALVIEHIPFDLQNKVDQLRREKTPDATMLAKAVDWPKLGWPDFDIYAPLFQVALEGRHPILGADRPKRRDSRSSGMVDAVLRGAPAFGPEEGDIARAWVPEMIASHCGLVDETVGLHLAKAQMVRDRVMADRVIVGLVRSGNVLFYSGKGHVRRDRGVPYLIETMDKPRANLVIGAFAIGEIEPDVATLRSLQAQYDIVLIAGEMTENDADMCAKLKQQGMGRP
jgi:uncharacterized iron-regulated protein